MNRDPVKNVMAYKYSPHNDNVLVAARVFKADNFFSRLGGLIFRQQLKENEALLLTGCKSIHTMFMRYPIDVLFLSSEGKIISIIKNIRPWRFTPFMSMADSVLELRSGVLEKIALEEGERIIFI